MIDNFNEPDAAIEEERMETEAARLVNVVESASKKKVKQTDLPANTSPTKKTKKDKKDRNICSNYAPGVKFETAPGVIRRLESGAATLITADEPERPARSPSPARNPVTKIVHIRNLVRPFTLHQLKELLGRYGTLIEEDFWIDKIKSHCFASYATVEEAENTRRALHNTRWPQSNPKTLTADFAAQDQPAAPAEAPKERPSVRETHPGARDGREKEMEARRREREQRIKEREEREKKSGPVREWDRDKKSREDWDRTLQKSRSRSRDNVRSPSPRARKADRDRGQSAEKINRRDVKKDKKEDEPPAKLLDDLFKKTKTAPCIYWLPLTELQVQAREKQGMLKPKLRQRSVAGDLHSPIRDGGEIVEGPSKGQGSEVSQGGRRDSRGAIQGAGFREVSQGGRRDSRGTIQRGRVQSEGGVIVEGPSKGQGSEVSQGGRRDNRGAIQGAGFREVSQGGRRDSRGTIQRGQGSEVSQGGRRDSRGATHGAGFREVSQGGRRDGRRCHPRGRVQSEGGEIVEGPSKGAGFQSEGGEIVDEPSKGQGSEIIEGPSKGQGSEGSERDHPKGQGSEIVEEPPLGRGGEIIEEPSKGQGSEVKGPPKGRSDNLGATQGGGEIGSEGSERGPSNGQGSEIIEGPSMGQGSKIIEEPSKGQGSEGSEVSQGGKSDIGFRGESRDHPRGRVQRGATQGGGEIGSEIIEGPSKGRGGEIGSEIVEGPSKGKGSEGPSKRQGSERDHPKGAGFREIIEGPSKGQGSERPSKGQGSEIAEGPSKGDRRGEIGSEIIEGPSKGQGSEIIEGPSKGQGSEIIEGPSKGQGSEIIEGPFKGQGSEIAEGHPSGRYVNHAKGVSSALLEREKARARNPMPDSRRPEHSLELTVGIGKSNRQPSGFKETEALII
ncbi:hypothetical protein DPMN_178098 [Dreissena polymorpha]|uniref:RRM domain-containing protein n=1 Tax=Dreissena polymorpha TaxID=45954 RepID=A0A9D4EA85_DREPO|nr:hypothetical protein DPMN_178098 [Dreissena polymorpha]